MFRRVELRNKGTVCDAGYVNRDRSGEENYKGSSIIPERREHVYGIGEFSERKRSSKIKGENR